MIKVLLSENDVGDAERIAELFAPCDDIRVVGIGRDGLETAQLIAQTHPDVALLHAHMAALDGLEACRFAALASPETASIILSNSGLTDGEARECSMRAGARGVVNLTTDPAALVPLVRQLAENAPQRDADLFKLISDPSRMPVTIAVTGAKGGIGKTMLATNLALVMEQRFPSQTALVDFVGHYGDVNLLLDVPAGGGILDLTTHAEVDSSLLGSRMVEHSSGLHFLPGVNGPESMSAAGRIDTAWVSSLLGVLRREYRIIVFDVAAVLYPLSQYIFRRSSFVVVVSVLADLTTMRDTGSLVRGLLDEHVTPERVKLVANRTDREDEFTVSQLEELVHFPVACEIPRDKETVMRALNDGHPFVISKPKTPVARAVNRLADILIS